jgi:hypothetical protein
MSGSPKAPYPAAGACPFCGVATGVPHESQEGCIAALHAEIGRMRDILSMLRPAGVRDASLPEDDGPASIRLRLSDHDTH